MSFFKSFAASLLAWVIGVAVLIIGSVSVIVGALLSMESSQKPIENNTVLYFDLNEAIIDSPLCSPLSTIDAANLSVSESLTLVKALAAIDYAATDPNIKGICISLVNKENTNIANLEELRRALLRFKSSGKFIVAYSNSYSQYEYYLSSVADNIVLNPEGGLDWRGVGLSAIFYKGLLDKLDIEVAIFRPTVCKYKSAVEPYFLTKMSEANRKQCEALANSIWNSICDDISEVRNISKEMLMQSARDMSIVFAEDALRVGMIDAVAHEDYMNTLYDGYGVERNDMGLHNTITFGEYASLIDCNTLTTSVGSEPYATNSLVAIIYADGQIVDGNLYEDNSVYGSRLATELRQARLDEDTKAVVLRVNSPGGSALASEVAWREMVLLQQVKPVVVSMGSMAASGGYYISAPADYIFADKTTLTGSIGVFGMIPNINNFLRYRLGITIDSVGTSPAALGMSLLEPLSNEQKASITKSVDRIYTTFTSHVAEGRNMSIEEVYNVAEGREWSGVMGKECGLVDAIGGINEAIGKAVELADIANNYTIYEFVPPLTPFEEWLNSFGAQYASVLGLDFNIYGKELCRMIEEVPVVFTTQGIQTLHPGNLKIEF
ncbi:MAG: signal peptide peptidase SppA [Alistipes sp.]|nr:signal peptide peptidase SppA [Alistipes sp.]